MCVCVVFIAYKNLDGLVISKPVLCLQYFIFSLTEIEINDKLCHISMVIYIHAIFTEENQVNILTYIYMFLP